MKKLNRLFSAVVNFMTMMILTGLIWALVRRWIVEVSGPHVYVAESLTAILMILISLVWLEAMLKMMQKFIKWLRKKMAVNVQGR